LLLISDGNVTQGDVEAAASAAAALNVPIDVMPINFDLKDEVLVERFVAPTWRRENDPFTIEVILRANIENHSIIRKQRGDAHRLCRDDGGPWRETVCGRDRHRAGFHVSDRDQRRSEDRRIELGADPQKRTGPEVEGGTDQPSAPAGVVVTVKPSSLFAAMAYLLVKVSA